jgi:hypothetical protein
LFPQPGQKKRKISKNCPKAKGLGHNCVKKKCMKNVLEKQMLFCPFGFGQNSTCKNNFLKHF